ncbi:hypothetical protein KAR91_27680 [Candidatus Pacearchaeota archaeon]|nr:hypothetical protein [Candidatus Pacearchaeota archaeon]
MADYLELLIHTSDTFYRDPIKNDYDKDYDLASNVKQGYLQCVKPIGSPWGRLELDPKHFIRIIIPELQFNPDWLAIGDDEILKKKWRFPLDKLLSSDEFEALKNITYNEPTKNLLPIIKSIERLQDIATLVKYDDQIAPIKLHGSAGDFDIEEDGGGDYTSLQTALDDQATDISGGSEDANFFINLAWDNPDPNNNFDIDGWTMGTNNMLIQTTGESRSSTGTWKSDGYRISGGTEGFDIEVPNVTVDGLQFIATGNIQFSGFIAASASADNIKIENCIMDAGDFVVVGMNISAGDCDIENCIIYNANGSTSSNGMLLNAGVVNIMNCVVTDFQDGIESDGGTNNVYNSLVFNNGDDFDDAGQAFNTINYCASDDSQAGTGNFQITQTASNYAALVTDAPNGDFSPTDVDSELVDSGSAANRSATDIIGNSWDTDDIGAIAFPAAGGVTQDPSGTLPAMAGAVTRQRSYQRAIGGSI